jgi:two-component system phosphate regulon response regulator PhoB
METKKTILIIEDDPAQQEIYRITLQRGGYSTVVRGDAIAGLKWLEQILPDLILLDVMLPQLSGVEMLAQVRLSPNGRDVPIVLATASATIGEADVQHFRISAFLRKPLLPSVLLDAIKQALAN